MHNLKALLPYLHVFHTVAQQKSFTKAADVLCVNQSSVSYQIKKLEELLDKKLLLRSQRTDLSLTDAGQILFDTSSKVFDELQQGLGLLESDHDLSELRLGGSSVVSTLLLTHALVQLRHLFPDLPVEMRADDTVAHIEQSIVDVALRPYSGHSDDLVAKPFARVEMGLYCAPSYFVNHVIDADGVGIEDAHIVRVALDDDWLIFQQENIEIDFDATRQQVLDNKLSVVAAARAGLGIALLPRIAARQDLAEGSLIPVASNLQAQIMYYLVYRADAQLDDYVDVIGATLAEYCEKHHATHVIPVDGLARSNPVQQNAG